MFADESKSEKRAMGEKVQLGESSSGILGFVKSQGSRSFSVSSPFRSSTKQAQPVEFVLVSNEHPRLLP